MWRAILAALTLLATVLAGCGHKEDPTLPAPTTISESATATTVAPTQVAVAEPTATDVPTSTPAATATPTVEPSQTPRQRRAVTLTILHTNDVMGATDPCG